MRRVLVVDDSSGARTALRAIVEGFGFAVDEAADGTAAVQRLKAAPFDLVFVDVHMPVLDGPSLIRILRAHAIDVRVVLITTGAPTSMIAAAVRLGVSDYVRKPFDPEQVRVSIARALDIPPASFGAEAVRLLLCTRTDDTSPRLRELLPAHVGVDVLEPGAAVDARDVGGYPLILLDPSVSPSAAAQLRAAAPLASIFGLRDGAPPEPWWSPDGTRDGVIPRQLDGAVARDFLYANFLRQLVFAEGSVFGVVAFEGPPRFVPAYFGALERALVRRAVEMDPTLDLVIDLRRVPPDAPAVAQLVRQVHALLQASGPVAAFRTTAPLRQALAGAADLRHVIVFSQ